MKNDTNLKHLGRFTLLKSLDDISLSVFFFLENVCLNQRFNNTKL